MKHLLSTLALALTAFAAHAQPPAASAPQAPEAAADARRDVADRFCLRETGSRVMAHRHAQAVRARGNDRAQAAAPDCVAASGRSYSREDLDRTGSVDAADALRRLDPAIR